MSSRTRKRKATTRGLCLRLRVVGVAGDALGPGKAQLIEEVAGTGSLREAAFRLEVSYMKAWRLAEAMNDNFRSPLLKKSRGGSNRGGTRLTELRRKALMTYHRMTSRAGQAAETIGKNFQPVEISEFFCKSLSIFQYSEVCEIGRPGETRCSRVGDRGQRMNALRWLEHWKPSLTGS